MNNLDLGTVTWGKSSYSGNNGGDCVEIASGIPGRVPVRDSKVQDGPVLLVGAPEFTAFVESVKSN